MEDTESLHGPEALSAAVPPQPPAPRRQPGRTRSG